MIALEHVTTDPATARNFEVLRALVPDTGGRSIGVRMGVATVTWPGGTPVASAVSVSHGLPVAPVTIQLTAIASTNPVIAFVNGTPTATTFSVKGRIADGSSPANGTTQNFYWLALG